MHESPVVFDLDGTLLDSLQDLAASLNAVLAHLHCAQHSVETVRTMIGRGTRILLERGLGPANGHKVEQALELFEVEYRARLLKTSTLYPGIEACLAALRADGRSWAIATNKPSGFTAAILDGLDLHRFGLTSWASADEVAHKKPAPDVIQLAAERGGFATVEPARFTYVGDMPVDVECGRRFGCPTVGVSWGFDPEGLKMAAPSRMVSTAEALLEVLKGRKESDKHQDPPGGGGSVSA